MRFYSCTGLATYLGLRIEKESGGSKSVMWFLVFGERNLINGC